MIINKSARYVTAYLMWLIGLLLGLWLAIISRDDFLGILAQFYIRDSPTYLQRAKFFDKAFIVVLGLLWLIFMIASEEYYRNAAARGKLLKRFANLTGLLLLFIFVVDLILFWLQGVSTGDWFRWLVLTGELVIGIVFLLFSRSSPSSGSG
jgi:uncharacterized membrane protein